MTLKNIYYQFTNIILHQNVLNYLEKLFTLHVLHTHFQPKSIKIY